MTYAELKAKYPDKEFGNLVLKRNWEPTWFGTIKDLGWGVESELFVASSLFLNDAKQLLSDLQAAIKYAEENT